MEKEDLKIEVEDGVAVGITRKEKSKLVQKRRIIVGVTREEKSKEVQKRRISGERPKSADDGDIEK